MLEHNVKDFGAVGDGVTDDTFAFQQAELKRRVEGGNVYVPPGVHVINSPIEISDFSNWVGHSIIPYSMDWPNDWQKQYPSYGKYASVVQRGEESGPLFTPIDGKVHPSFEGITMRCGRRRTEQDMAFWPPPRKTEVTRCRFENFQAVFKRPDTHLYAVRAHHNRIIGCTIGFDGKIYDSSIEANVFTSCGVGVWLVASAANRISDNRFEWSDYGIVGWSARDSFITANEFDSCKSVAIKLTKAQNLTVTGSMFRRSGKVMTQGKRSHILLIGGEIYGVTFTGNSFSEKGDDRTNADRRPEHIIEVVNGTGSHVIWTGNDSIDGCLKEPILDRRNNSYGWLDADQFDVYSEYYPSFMTIISRASMINSMCRVRPY